MSIHAAARVGLGIADLPIYLIGDDIKQKRLVQVLADYVDSPRYVWAVYSGSRTIPKKVKVFVELLRASFLQTI